MKHTREQRATDKKFGCRIPLEDGAAEQCELRLGDAWLQELSVTFVNTSTIFFPQEKKAGSCSAPREWVVPMSRMTFVLCSKRMRASRSITPQFPLCYVPATSGCKHRITALVWCQRHRVGVERRRDHLPARVLVDKSQAHL